MARVLVANQPSSEREKVTVAPIASSSVGRAAMTENNATMRMCRRAPGVRCFQAWARPTICHASKAIIDRMSSALIDSTTSTTSLRGRMGVRSVRIR